VHAKTPPPDTFGGKNRGAGSHERIQHDIAAPGAVPNRIGDHRHRLDGGVDGEVIHPPGAEGVDAGIAPDIGAVASMAAQFDIVAMLRCTVAEDKYQLML